MTGVVLAKTGEMSRADWLEARKAGIGGSDAAAVLGLDPYRSRFAVWIDKTSLAPDPGDQASEAMRWGHLLEDVVAREYAARTGYRLRRRHAILQDPDRPWMLFNADRFAAHPQVGTSLVEIKTANQHAAVWADADEGPPDHVVCQVQHGLSVTGLALAHVAVLIGGSTFRYWDVERDDDLIAMLRTAEEQFWYDHVLPGVHPPVDGAASTTRALQMLHPSEEPGRAVDLPADIAGLLVERAQRVELRKTSDGRVAEIDNQVRGLLGDAEVGLVDGRPAVTLKTRRASVVRGHERPATRILRYNTGGG